MKDSWHYILENLLSSTLLGFIAGGVRALLRPAETWKKTIAIWVGSILLAQLVGLITRDIALLADYRDAIIGAAALVSKETFEYLQIIMKDPWDYFRNRKS